MFNNMQDELTNNIMALDACMCYTSYSRRVESTHVELGSKYTKLATSSLLAAGQFNGTLCNITGRTLVVHIKNGMNQASLSRTPNS